MKYSVLTALLLLLSLATQAQQLRYFEFKTECGYNNWRDTTFIAATSDPAVIADVLADLQKPRIERKLIIGSIASGNGGYNRNAGHWFSWHFVPEQWHLQEMAMEVCDGCPYSDIDQNPTYWINQLGEFCPWTSSVAREVTHLLGDDKTVSEPEFAFFPNPARHSITVKITPTPATEISIRNALGQPMKTARNAKEIDVRELPAGLYFLWVSQGQKVQIRKVIIE